MRKRVLELLGSVPNPPKLSPFLNRRIDEILHPAAEEDKRLYVVDSLAHMLVETADAVMLSIVKSVRYNLTKVIGSEEE